MAFKHLAVKVAPSFTIQYGSPSIRLGTGFPLLQFMSTGKKRGVEQLWRDFFSNTTQWWDHRPGKSTILHWSAGFGFGLQQVNPRFPDFKHKQTRESLWVVDLRNPPWVQAELAAIPPGKLQSNPFAWNHKLQKYVKSRQYSQTIQAFHQMQQEGICLDGWTFLPVLNACAHLGALEEGRHVHAQIIRYGCESDLYVASCLVDMYAKCGSIEDAWTVFNKMPDRNVVTWNSMIGGYVKSGQGLKAMELFWKMQKEGVNPDSVTFVCTLNACASLEALEDGRRIHEQIVRRGFASDVYVGNSLVDMYAKCGFIEDAWSVFNKMSERNVVTWSTMIGGYVKSGQGLEALKLFRKMQEEGVEPNAVTLVGLLNACACVSDLEEGRRVHAQIIEGGWELDVFVATSLVDMYSKCGSIEDARTVFNRMPEHDTVTWNAMIGGCVASGKGLLAIELFQQMRLEGSQPNCVTFVGVLNACACVLALEEGRRVHQEIIQRGFESDVFVGSSLVDMYAKCGSIEDARTVFNTMPTRDVVIWNAMISGYGMHGHADEAIRLFEQMRKEGVAINEITFVCLLSACSHGGLVTEGMCYFETMSSHFNILPNVDHYACMVDLLGRGGRLEETEDLRKRMPL